VTDPPALTLDQTGQSLIENRRALVQAKADLEQATRLRACLVTDAERAAALAELCAPLDELEEMRTLLDTDRAATTAKIKTLSDWETVLEASLIEKYRAEQASREKRLAARELAPPIALPAGVRVDHKPASVCVVIDPGALPRECLAPDLKIIKALGASKAPAGVKWQDDWRVVITLGKAQP